MQTDLISSNDASNDVLVQQMQQTLENVFISCNVVNPLLAVAFSGGLDSYVLLHVLHAARKNITFQLQAHHVHHGLSVNADYWANFCQSTCHQLNIHLTVSRVSIQNKIGLGFEATARKARYEALTANNADFIVLAHHQDDQAETLLLQLARGAGVKGLAGMAALDINRKLLRPFLNVPRIEL